MNVSTAATVPPDTVLVGCGILHREVNHLIAKNDWPLATHFLQSALHNYLDRLHQALDTGLAAEERAGRRTIVLYGACHPGMERLLAAHGTCRTHGQNCIAMLLGYERFMDELCKGAYFLLEDWALSWEPMITACFGTNRAVVREIFHGSHEYLAGVRTPCSQDFTAAAEAAARFVDLPLVWLDAGLDPLEQVLAAAMAERGARDCT